MTDYSKMTDEELNTRIKLCATDLQTKVKELADLLTELRKRGQTHPLMFVPILKDFAAISSGKLSVNAALEFGGNSALMEQVKKMPVARQDDLANGGTIPVVEINPQGKQVTVQRRVGQLTNRDLNRVLNNGKVASVAAQKKSLTPAAQLKEVAGLIVDITNRKLQIGGKSIAPMELAKPLKELGFRLVRIDADEGDATFKSSRS